MPGSLFVISGPSGVGKGTVLRDVLAHLPQARKSVSVTTREPTPREVLGDEYFFVDEDEFQRRVANGEFLEWAGVHGHRYGTPAAWVDEQLANGTDVVLEIDVQGGMQVREKRPAACLVFLSPPSLEELERRIRGRGRDDDAEIEGRLGVARCEMAFAPEYDHNVVNDDLESAVEQVVEIIRHCREAQAGRRTAT
jgi:guanylate kinase